MSSCEDKLTAIVALCENDNTALCDSIRAINDAEANGVDDLWGKDENKTFTWQMIGLALLGLWLCYWVGWFWMAGGLGTTTTTQKIGEKKRRSEA